ncbi:hypothetical protein ACFE04_028898 [Oxalis oulophora]
MKTKGPKSSCWEEIIPSLVYELRPPPYLIADGASVTGGRDRKFARRARPLTQPAAQWDRSLAQATTIRVGWTCHSDVSVFADQICSGLGHCFSKGEHCFCCFVKGLS